jgi:hypothetical protein
MMSMQSKVVAAMGLRSPSGLSFAIVDEFDALNTRSKDLH